LVWRSLSFFLKPESENHAFGIRHEQNSFPQTYLQKEHSIKGIRNSSASRLRHNGLEFDYFLLNPLGFGLRMIKCFHSFFCLFPQESFQGE